MIRKLERVCGYNGATTKERGIRLQFQTVLEYFRRGFEGSGCIQREQVECSWIGNALVSRYRTRSTSPNHSGSDLDDSGLSEHPVKIRRSTTTYLSAPVALCPVRQTPVCCNREEATAVRVG